MPLLGFGKQRLNPYRPFANRLLICRCLVVDAHSVQVVLIEIPMHYPSVVAGRAVLLERAAVAILSFGPLLDLPARIFNGPEVEHLALRTGVNVALGRRADVCRFHSQ
jgi:hypothetical protein